jgi:hypothetical protein
MSADLFSFVGRDPSICLSLIRFHRCEAIETVRIVEQHIETGEERITISVSNHSSERWLILVFAYSLCPGFEFRRKTVSA